MSQPALAVSHSVMRDLVRLAAMEVSGVGRVGYVATYEEISQLIEQELAAGGSFGGHRARLGEHQSESERGADAHAG